MELRVLRYFLAVAREGNITAAANSLHMTQPTLSRQLRDLEEELGQKLLVRGNHWMTLTAEGMFLRKRAEEIVAMADKTEEEFRAMKGDLSGDIYIGGGETDAMNLIAAVCRELQEEHPGIRYHLFSGNAQDVTERLDKGLLDFGLLIQPTDIAKYDYLSLPAKDSHRREGQRKPVGPVSPESNPDCDPVQKSIEIKNWNQRLAALGPCFEPMDAEFHNRKEGEA